ncbi:putative F-box/LRR-repeat protein 22 [Telopea speciosissima]|uniref:putative F-box/LRR-repeat protein 22 n=1 Tax=Telopea speciosissima TaxID=54955 RepID=UPI001CC37BB7|nr:putative F-box/LRR-repeat protein 22 [Telopea speciosissima]
MVGLESLTLEIPFVCKSWYKASLNPQCWKILRFPPSLCEDEDSWWYDDGFIGRFMDEYRIQNFSVTGFVKLVVRRSHNSAVAVILPTDCTSEVLELISNQCPSLKYLGFPYDLLSVHHGKLIQELIKISNFVGDKEASAIANILPNIKYLRLKETSLPRESLKIILQGCRELVLLDARNCIGFEAEDDEILKMASHIKTFMFQGSTLGDR